MSETSITCTYLYSFRELRRAITAQRRASHFRQWWLPFGVVLLFLGQGIFETWRLVEPIGINAAFEENGKDILISFLPFIVISIIMGALLSYPGYWLSKRSLKNFNFFNQMVAYTFGDTGYLFEAPSIRGEIGWERITRCRETDEGFVNLFGKNFKTYVWLPKSGFTSVEEINRYRSLVQDKVKDFRQI